MKYILIIIWLSYGSNSPHVSLAVEYNNLESCQEAGKIIYKQAPNLPSVMLCTPKGKEIK